jgi:hypothetical protein
MRDLLLTEASRRLRRRPGRPRKVVNPVLESQSVVAPEASAPHAAPPLDRVSAFPVAEVWPIQARLVGLEDAGRFLGISSWTIRDYVAAGILEPVRLPGKHGYASARLLLDVRDLEALVTAGKGLAAPPRSPRVRGRRRQRAKTVKESATS